MMNIPLKATQHAISERKTPRRRKKTRRVDAAAAAQLLKSLATHEAKTEDFVHFLGATTSNPRSYILQTEPIKNLLRGEQGWRREEK